MNTKNESKSNLKYSDKIQTLYVIISMIILCVLIYFFETTTVWVTLAYSIGVGLYLFLQAKQKADTIALVLSAMHIVLPILYPPIFLYLGFAIFGFAP